MVNLQPVHKGSQSPILTLVHSLRLDRSIKTFHDYAEKKVIPFIEKHLATTDVICDWYLSNSLKATIRQGRGSGVQQRLPSNVNGKIPKNWNSYLHNETNKIELFQYLSGMIAQSNFDEGKLVITISDKKILQILVLITMWSNRVSSLSMQSEEFDTRVMLRAANAASQGHKHILIIANDTDVIVLGIFLHIYWCREIVGVIWNGQEVKVYFHP